MESSVRSGFYILMDRFCGCGTNEEHDEQGCGFTLYVRTMRSLCAKTLMRSVWMAQMGAVPPEKGPLYRKVQW